MTDDELKTKVVEIITEWVKGPGFSARKLTDTPTDALQVVNKKYVDAKSGLNYRIVGGDTALLSTPDSTVSGTTSLNIQIQSGNGLGSGGSGYIELIAGNAGATGVGGEIILTGGTGGVTSGNGGEVNIQGGEAINGTGGLTVVSGGPSVDGGNGGDLTLQGGTATGSGRNGGNLNLYPGATNSGSVGHIMIFNLPTSSAGLPSNAIWLNSNVLTIIP